MVGWLTIYSMGQHLYMPMSNSIGMSLATEGKMGIKLGQINSVNTAVFLATSLITALLFKLVPVNYRIAFLISTLSFLVAALFIFFMKPLSETRRGKRFVIRKEYKVFYGLSILFGARKQIFITFGPWVLIKVFGQGVSTFAILSFFIAGLGIVFKPLIGYLIDKTGERFVLAGEAIVLIFVCLGYAFSKGKYYRAT